ncbi:unnamed protein product [Nezara viridula]|uniref:Protein neuralized n=1 Tax=Nezara viridula TaxID=85310 RepID=A0A9P0E0E8_NEZVI|nr:unnamed protein product [Nezara viridula]
MGVSSVFQPKASPGIASTKMKMFKKVKKRLGIGRVSSGPNPASNLPPLQFHPVHGENVRLYRDGSVAKRTESFCKGLAFSARPVRLQEKICIKFLEVSTNWSGVLRFGFTSNDPGTLRYNLPKYACPDLTNKPGYWAKALAERLCERDAVLFYYVTAAGDVHFGVNGEEKGIFFSGVDTRGQLWAMLDIYGNSTAVEFVDSNHHLNNSRRHGDDEVDRIITPALANVSLQPQPVTPQPVAADTHPAEIPPLRFQHHNSKFTPFPFHRVRGRNIRLSTDRTVASRLETEFCNGYVFTARPIQLGERLVIQVLNTEPHYMGALTLGLTSCDPATLDPHRDLPEDPDCLLDRPEYWVLSKDLAGWAPQPGDELSFTVTRRGEVVVSKNSGPQVTVMHVDESLTLWAFLDVYGSTQRVRLMSHIPQQQPPPAPPVQQNVSPPRRGAPQDQCCPVTVATAPGVGGGTVLVVSLPPPGVRPPPASHQSQVAVYSPTYIEPVSGAGFGPSPSTDRTPPPDLRHWAETLRPGSGGEGPDCSVCYERQVDSVLYTCGHMCMCYDCSLQQWRGKGGGHCPLCRAVIRDVIRTFKS